MKIGMIGLGAIGGPLAKKLSTAGHHVKVTKATNLDELPEIARELGATPATIQEVLTDVDVIIVSIPTKAIPDLPKDLFGNVPDGVVIIETTNYYPMRDGWIEELEKGKVESLWVSEQIGRPVIKAFNNLLAHTLVHGGQVAGEQDRIALAVSGDEKNAKAVVARLINDAGFDAVDAGRLSESWRQQPGTPAYCTELNAAELTQALADAVKEKAPGMRDFAIKNLMDRTVPPTHEDMIALNRSLYPKNPKHVA